MTLKIKNTTNSSVNYNKYKYKTFILARDAIITFTFYNFCQFVILRDLVGIRRTHIDKYFEKIGIRMEFHTRQSFFCRFKAFGYTEIFVLLQKQYRCRHTFAYF